MTQDKFIEEFSTKRPFSSNSTVFITYQETNYGESKRPFCTMKAKRPLNKILIGVWKSRRVLNQTPNLSADEISEEANRILAHVAQMWHICAVIRLPVTYPPAKRPFSVPSS